MSSPTRIAELAALIQKNTAILDDYLNTNGLPTPSFDESTPPVLHLPKDTADVREAIIEATDELHSLLLGPVMKVYEEIAKSSFFISASSIARLGLASSFPQGSTTTFAALTSHAQAVANNPQIPLDAIIRLVRHGIAHRIFAEPAPGVIAHTAASCAIVNFHGLGAGMQEFTSTLWPTGPRLLDAVLRWPGSGEPNEAAYNLVSGKSEIFWEEYARDKGKMQRFADAMVFLGAKPGLEVERFLDAVDWTGAEVVVDVGGSQGKVARELVKRLGSGGKVVVQDREEVIRGVVESDETKDGRVEFQAHDFFTEQKFEGADVYVLRLILHDWSDKYCQAILRGLVPALKKGARIIVNDSILPEPGQVSKYQEMLLRQPDLMMWSLFNAKERDEADFRRLFADTDDRFKVTRIARPPGQALGVVEVVWQG